MKEIDGGGGRDDRISRKERQRGRDCDGRTEKRRTKTDSEERLHVWERRRSGDIKRRRRGKGGGIEKGGKGCQVVVAVT